MNSLKSAAVRPEKTASVMVASFMTGAPFTTYVTFPAGSSSMKILSKTVSPALSAR